MKYIDELKKSDLEGKKVLLRVDFNVAVDDQGNIEDFRIKSSRETINYLLDAGASVLMISHVDEPLTSFEPIKDKIAVALGREFSFVSLPDFLARNYKLEANNFFLVDNIRQDAREKQNDLAFAQSLAQGFDLFVNDAFAVMHRDHASVSAIAHSLTSYGGLLVKKEISHLSEAINKPASGKVLILGGAKISTKLPVIQNFLGKAEKILIGGALANDFYKAKGIKIGDSISDDTIVPDLPSEVVITPSDMLVATDKTGGSEPRASSVVDIADKELIIDIGPETSVSYATIIAQAKTIIWNGPMGLSEVEKFSQGTKSIALAVSGCSDSVIGGGDTIAAVAKQGLLEKYGFISTGGGAMLEFLAGNKLPGLEALGYYE